MIFGLAPPTVEAAGQVNRPAAELVVLFDWKKV